MKDGVKGIRENIGSLWLVRGVLMVIWSFLAVGIRLKGCLVLGFNVRGMFRGLRVRIRVVWVRQEAQECVQGIGVRGFSWGRCCWCKGPSMCEVTTIWGECFAPSLGASDQLGVWMIRKWEVLGSGRNDWGNWASGLVVEFYRCWVGQWDACLG